MVSLSHDEIVARVESHRDQLPETLVELSAFPIAFRRVIVNLANKLSQCLEWLVHLSRREGFRYRRVLALRPSRESLASQQACWPQVRLTLGHGVPGALCRVSIAHDVGAMPCASTAYFCCPLRLF
jgi:hypothetical protein